MLWPIIPISRDCGNCTFACASTVFRRSIGDGDDDEIGCVLNDAWAQKEDYNCCTLNLIEVYVNAHS